MSLVSSAARAGVITLLAELSCDRTRKIQFREKSLSSLYRFRLVVESDMRVCLSNITPRIDSLCKAKQAHLSH